MAGDQVGELVICPARGEPALSAADARVIAALVAPVAAIVHATPGCTGGWPPRTSGRWPRPQQERSRIRRDLHDGLGPSLSGVALGLEAVQAALPEDTETAAELTARMRTEIAGAVEDVRRIIDELRPAALEDVGLAQALRERAASLVSRSASGMVIEVRAADPMPGPARAGRDRCFPDRRRGHDQRAQARPRQPVRGARWRSDDALVVSVSDNGIGLPGQTRPDGIGLASMRQRAGDLGGCCTVSSGQSRPA